MDVESAQLGEFAASISATSTPTAVVAKLKATLLHNLGMVRAGQGLAGPAIAVAKTYDGPGSSSLLHDGRRTHRDRAVVANAAMMHARTQDDTHLPTITHLAATCLPALFSIAEDVGATGPELLDAMLASYEVGGAIAEGVGPVASSRGFRPSSFIGGMAASAGVGRLLGLDAQGIAAAIGLAASFGGGTGQTWVAGTQEWQYQVGVAGRNGMLAAELAQEGVLAAPDALEGAAGLYAAFTGGREPHGPSFDLGLRWRTLEVTYKPFPVCAINQMPVTVLLAMFDALGLSAADIDEMSLRLSPAEAAYPGTETYGPFAGVGGALMSAPYCLAIAARERTVTRSSIEDLANPDVLELASRIAVVSDSTLSPGQCVLSIDGPRGNFSSTEIPTPATFDWTFEEVQRRLSSLGPELHMSAEALDGLVAALLDVERLTVADVIEATVRP